MHINIRISLKILGILTLIEGISMLLCTPAAVYYKEWSTASALLSISLICICVGSVLQVLLHFDKLHLKAHEGFLFAFVSWLYCSLIGTLPFYFSGQGYSLASSFFEAVAGFSTTGCSVFNLDTMPHGLILWRAVSNWLGGMGILVLLVSIFPALGISGQSIAIAETTGPTLEKVGAKFSDTGKILYLTYITFSVVEFLLLLVSPLSFFDALVNTFTSVSTGGLIVTAKNAAIFEMQYVRAVILVFTLLSSMNYTLYYFMLNRNFKAFFQNIEIRIFGLIIGIAVVLISISLKWTGTYSSLWQAFKDSLCQVVAFISTSGYYVCDYTQWPTFAIVVLFTLLFIGGCCMSTSGSLKVIRVIVLLKLVKRGIFKQIHPNSVKAVVINGKAVSSEKVSAITAHIILFFAVFFFSCVVLSLNNFDMETTISTTIGLFSNTGMALGVPGASGYFGMFNSFSQIYMAFLMIAGRLEIYAVLLLFSKTFWSIDRVRSV